MLEVEGKGMNCPRCQVPLTPVEVAGTQVDLCPQCEGSWYDVCELNRMFKVPDKTMKSSSLLKPGHPVDVELPTSCPHCQAPMERNRYLSDCPVLVDRCPEHGIWLDGGELGALLDHLARSVRGSVRGHPQENPVGFLEALKHLFGG